jgi:hypothetical protein
MLDDTAPSAEPREGSSSLTIKDSPVCIHGSEILLSGRISFTSCAVKSSRSASRLTSPSRTVVHVLTVSVEASR